MNTKQVSFATLYVGERFRFPGGTSVLIKETNDSWRDSADPSGRCKKMAGSDLHTAVTRTGWQAYREPATIHDLRIEPNTAAEPVYCTFEKVLSDYLRKRPVRGHWQDGKYTIDNTYNKCLALLYEKLDGGKIPVSPH